MIFDKGDVDGENGDHVAIGSKPSGQCLHPVQLFPAQSVCQGQFTFTTPANNRLIAEFQTNEDYVDSWPRSFAVGVFGAQKVDIHFNQLRNPMLDFEVVSGCRVSQVSASAVQLVQLGQDNKSLIFPNFCRLKSEFTSNLEKHTVSDQDCFVP